MMIQKMRYMMATKQPYDLNMYFRGIAEKYHYLNRRPFINLHPGIAEMLATTRIDIPCGECQLPFDTFCINLPLDTSIMVEAEPGSKKDALPLCAIMVHQVRPQMAKETGEGLEDKRCILVVWKSQDTPDGGSLMEGLIIALEEGKTIDEQIDYSISQVKATGAQTTDDEIRQMYRIAIGAIFLAISKDKRYVARERIRVKGNELCYCGSGKKFKQCHGQRNEEYLGLGIGREISLPRSPTPESTVIIEGSGKELQFSHIRSGHMRWQWYKDEAGNPQRKLIFIHPLIVRPDLPMKTTTPRIIKRPESRFNPDYEYDYNDYVEDFNGHHPEGDICYTCDYEIEWCEMCDMDCCECLPCECCYSD